MIRFWRLIGIIGLFFLIMFIWTTRIAIKSDKPPTQITVKNCTIKKGRLKQTLICEPDWEQTNCHFFPKGICPKKEIDTTLRMTITKAQERLITFCLLPDAHCKMSLTRTKNGRFKGVSLHP